MNITKRAAYGLLVILVLSVPLSRLAAAEVAPEKRAVLDWLSQPEIVTKYSKTHPYKPFLPADAKPPLEFYEKLMKQYRPAMEPFYVDGKPGIKN